MTTMKSERHFFMLICIYIFSWFPFSLINQVDGAVRMPRNQLNEYISHFEPIEYERETLISNHMRLQKQQQQHKSIPFHFRAYGRAFNIMLKRDISLFTQDLHIDEADNFHPFNVYEGYIVNEPQSSVHGFIYDGIFEGRIHTGEGDEFHIESVKQYQHLDNKTMHSIIYNVKDIVHRELYKCGGVKPKPLHWEDHYNNTVWNHMTDIQDDISFLQNADHHRERRAMPTDKKECHLYIRADPTYIEWANNDNNRALYLLTQHVKRVSNIYKNTDFDKNGRADGYSLNIKRIGIIDTSKCKNENKGNCRYKPRYIGVEKFLDIASLDNMNAYCLSYVFCHRDFSDGVLGLAWIGDPNGVGGICDKYIQIGRTMKSLNTGIVSTLNYGKSVPGRVTDVTFAHEVGHNFGSQHDPKSGKCSPGGSSGNFVMYPRATSGTDANNKKFSECSAKYMWAVIQARARKCFKRQGEPICGNRVIEGNEECDCGYDNEPSCRNDKCCIGAPTVGFGSGCRFTSQAKRVTKNRCSPSRGICCNGETCKPYDKSAGKVCESSDDCSGVAICNSNSIQCPKPMNKPEKALCNNASNVCMNGKCTGSLCTLVDKISCQCNQTADFCNVCCQDKSRRQKCSVYLKMDKGKVRRPPGSPCENYEGYCDILYKCRKVDAEGPLSRLKKWLLSPESFENMLTWMKTYWWACILIGLGMVILMVAFIHCCSVHTPSSNPDKPPPKPLTLGRGGRGARPTAPPATSDPGGLSSDPPGYETTMRESRREQPSFEMR